MKEKITYIAADGKEFDEKDECIEYETACMIKGLHFYDDDKKPVLVHSDNFNRFCTVYYVQAESKEALDALNKLCEINGYDIIDYEELNTEYDDLFYWSDDDDAWHSLRNDIKELKDLAEHFQVFTEYEY